jgi:hypothetical protein
VNSIHLALRIHWTSNKLKTSSKTGDSPFSFDKSMLTGIEHGLEIMRNGVMNDKFKYFLNVIETRIWSVVAQTLSPFRKLVR